MLLDVITTYLEMTSPRQLVPGCVPSVNLDLERVDRASAAVAGSTFAAVGAPHHWTGRGDWSDRKWQDHVARHEVQTLLARVGGDVVGIVELESHVDDDVEITVFGLLPEFVGKGLGGHLLTLATRKAWETRDRGGVPTKRVWLHTNTLDHTNAKPNYERRGFRAFRTEHNKRDLPG